MNLSISTGLYYKKPFEEVLDIVSASDCKNIELFINQTCIEKSKIEIKEEIEKRGLKVQSLHAPIRLFTPDARGEIKLVDECIELAQMLGAKYIVTHDIFERGDDGKVYFDDREHFKTLEHFKNNSTVIMTENLPYKVLSGSKMYDIDWMHDFIKENDYKITFDVTHAGTCDYDIFKAYDLLKPYIRNIHLSDYKDGAEHVVLGEGELPIAKFLRYLKDDGYSCPLTVEYDFDNKERNDIGDDAQAEDILKRTIDFVNDIIF